MATLLQELRSALAHELALNGSFVPLGEGEESPSADLHEPVPGERTVPEVAATAPGEVAKDPREPMPALFSDTASSPEASSPDASSPYARIAGFIPPDSPLHRMDTLAEVEAYVRDTILIPLDERRLHPVFGVGNPQADLMIIGEAPGAEEDKRGEPFVGRAGQLLNKILAAIGFDRADVYICNILKSRPPNNRDPLPAEVAAHIPLLYKQIALIQPKLVLAVGKTAGNGLLEKRTSLASLRGTFHDYHGLPLMVTYHPAALLRNPQWKRPTWEDVKLLRTRYDQISSRAIA